MPSASLPSRFSFGRFSIAGAQPFVGVVVDERVVSVHALEPRWRRHGHRLPASATLFELLQDWDAALAAVGDAIAPSPGATGVDENLPWVPVTALGVHAPLPDPGTIYCSGANYKKHVIDIILAGGGEPGTEHMSRDELRAHGIRMMDERAAHGKPFVFFKSRSSIVGPYDNVVLPHDVVKPDWELELGVVIGKPTRRVRRAQALDHVAGYMVVNDITSRELVNRPDIPQMGMDWMASKSTPTFLPQGPYLVPAAFVGNPQDLQITLRLNGQVMQDESTADMIFDVARLIEFISAHVQLQPGDLIATGSPAGNGIHHGRLLRAGDVMESTITGLGVQRNRCIAES
ncbi:fumarylacetoacetate hydrolase family protein [Dyella sp. C9]|uniref:fumarylacetoacetate hydrolase family protein n=1 Tax=Dyella sp. C9 TaxID=2202154 RepID=UPI000DEFE6DB|nr:fumarylacetoacetate hydrolase family protein [Dyella sp. C9]